MAGDCDAKSMLVAALLGAVGIPSRFVVVGVQPTHFKHVYLQAKIKDCWIGLDPIMRQHDAGWEFPAPRNWRQSTRFARNCTLNALSMG